MPIGRLNNYTLEILDIDDDTTVTHAPTSITNALTPPPGFVYEILSLSVSIPDPAGSAAGTHSLLIQPAGAASNQRIFKIDANTGSTIVCKYNQWTATTVNPGAAAQQFTQLSACIASFDVPLNFVYTNSTDVDQAGTRAIQMLVKKYREAV